MRPVTGTPVAVTGLTRGRGLKLDDRDELFVGARVAPHAGAQIETISAWRIELFPLRLALKGGYNAELGFGPLQPDLRKAWRSANVGLIYRLAAPTTPDAFKLNNLSFFGIKD